MPWTAGIISSGASRSARVRGQPLETLLTIAHTAGEHRMDTAQSTKADMTADATKPGRGWMSLTSRSRRALGEDLRAFSAQSRAQRVARKRPQPPAPREWQTHAPAASTRERGQATRTAPVHRGCARVPGWHGSGCGDGYPAIRRAPYSNENGSRLRRCDSPQLQAHACHVATGHRGKSTRLHNSSTIATDDRPAPGTWATALDLLTPVRSARKGPGIGG